ncbi:hypothetical protein SBBP2_660014 [Burkholderiales bacterium]|nr:hypothetical protein SBBP2_660014 [Burkholderiales bacterium]
MSNRTERARSANARPGIYTETGGPCISEEGLSYTFFALPAACEAELLTLRGRVYRGFAVPPINAVKAWIRSSSIFQLAPPAAR